MKIINTREDAVTIEFSLVDMAALAELFEEATVSVDDHYAVASAMAALCNYATRVADGEFPRKVRHPQTLTPLRQTAD
jgi:hypothetical protein